MFYISKKYSEKLGIETATARLLLSYHMMVNSS